MITLQNTVVVLGGWIGVSFAAAAVWGLVGKAFDGDASHDAEGAELPCHAVLAGTTHASAAHDPEPDTLLAEALDGSPWAELGPLQDRIAGRRRTGAPDAFGSAR